MTISTTEWRIAYNGNGVTTVFAFPYRFLANAELKVLEVATNGTETPKTLTTHYTLTGAGDDAGGSVTMLTAPASGVTLVIYRDTAVVQEIDYISGDPFPAETHEEALDRLTMILQERVPDSGSGSYRTLVVPLGDSDSVNRVLPASVSRLDKVLSFNASTGGVEASPFTVTQVQSAIAAAYLGGAATSLDALAFIQSGTGAVTRTAQAKMRESGISVTDFGAVLDGVTSDQSALSAALVAASATVGTTQGNRVEIPQGRAVMSATLNIPNRVAIHGVNKRGSFLGASAGFSGSYMFTVVNGTSSMFDNALRDLTLDCSDVSGLGGVSSSAWQEGGGMRNVLITNCRGIGVLFDHGYGGAALCEIDQCEIFGSSVSASPAGIKVNEISAIGSFMLRVTNSTIAGGTSPTTIGIHMVKDSLHAQNVHFEDCGTGIYVDGPGHHVFIGVTGHGSVTNLFEIASTFTGTLKIIGCHRAGATNFLKDNRAGGYGTIASSDHDIDIRPVPLYGPGQINACGNFDGTGTPATTNTFGVTGIAKSGTGDYTVTEAYARPAAASGCISVNTNIASGHATVDLLSTTTFRIRTYNASNALADSSEIHFISMRVS